MEGKILSISQAVLNNMNGMRKTTVNYPMWKDIQARELKNAGLPYRSKNGMARPGKRGPSTEKTCSRECARNGCLLPHVDKVRTFRQFLELESWSAKSTYLAALMHRRLNGRRTECIYYVSVNGEKLECCRETFMDIYQVKRGTIAKLHKKIAAGVTCIKDGRGKHLNRPRRVSDDVKTAILNHIREFPQYESHYSRETHGNYLNPDLNLQIMFRMFCQKHPEIPEVESKSDMYRKIFKSTNLKIGHPKKDTCKKCDLLNSQVKNSPLAENRIDFKNQADLHHFTWTEARKAMNNDIIRSSHDPRYVVKVVDMQQMLFCPTLTHADVFYQRQYATYNYCVFDGATANANMYVWSETDAKRGVDEIGSIIMKCIREEYQPLADDEERTLVLWSDRCRGQTNNFFMILILMKLLELRYFTKVEQKFLVTGHSFLPCDSLFGSIEKRKRKCSVMVPDQWLEVIRTAQPNKPFHVVKIEQTDVLDIKNAFNAVPKPTSLKTSEIAWLEIRKESPHQILVRQEHYSGVWSKHVVHAPNQARIRIVNRRFITLHDLAIYVLAQKYYDPLPISAEKKKDLQNMMKFLSPEHQAYYLPLINNQNANEVEMEESD